jgi:hypothetical protein
MSGTLIFLHHQLFQESCCNVRDSGLARACVMDLYLESDSHINSEDGVNAWEPFISARKRNQRDSGGKGRDVLTDFRTEITY